MQKNVWGNEKFKRFTETALGALYMGSDHSPSIPEPELIPSEAEKIALRSFSPHIPYPGRVVPIDAIADEVEHIPRNVSACFVGPNDSVWLFFARQLLWPSSKWTSRDPGLSYALYKAYAKSPFDLEVSRVWVRIELAPESGGWLIWPGSIVRGKKNIDNPMSGPLAQASNSYLPHRTGIAIRDMDWPAERMCSVMFNLWSDSRFLWSVQFQSEPFRCSLSVSAAEVASLIAASQQHPEHIEGLGPLYHWFKVHRERMKSSAYTVNVDEMPALQYVRFGGARFTVIQPAVELIGKVRRGEKHAHKYGS